MHNLVRVTASPAEGVEIVSPLAEGERPAAEAMLQKAVLGFFKEIGRPGFGLRVSLTGNVPVGRGLGYSATARLGVVAALSEMTGAKWGRQELLDFVTRLEGHPDNVSPSIFGGFTVSGLVGQRVRCLRFPVSPKVRLVTLIPRFQVSTEAARRLLPDTLPRADAAHALNRAALITAAFAAKDYRGLTGVFDDPVHQPYREPLIPQLSWVIRAGEAAGAIGGFLSGSGSAIMCLALERAEEVGRAMQVELAESEVRILRAENKGFEIREGG